MNRRLLHMLLGIGPRLAGGGGGVSPYPDLLAALVSWWSLDEASGTRNDLRGTNHLTDVNTVGSAAGKQSNAASFVNANSEALTRSSNSTLQTGDVSFGFALWVSFTTISQTRGLLNKHNATPEYNLVYNATSSRFQWVIRNAFTLSANNFGAASTGTWYFVVASYDAATNQASLSINNGTPNTTTYAHDGTVGGDSFSVANNSGFYLDGLIDEVLFWKGYVLSSAERAWLYNSGNGRSYTDLAPS